MLSLYRNMRRTGEKPVDGKHQKRFTQQEKKLLSGGVPGHLCGAVLRLPHGPPVHDK
jgi:hypothetical protein